MNITPLETVEKFCPCCMQVHKLQKVLIQEYVIYKGRPFKFCAEHYSCNNANEFFETEEQMEANFVEMQEEYEKQED